MFVSPESVKETFDELYRKISRSLHLIRKTLPSTCINSQNFVSHPALFGEEATLFYQIPQHKYYIIRPYLRNEVIAVI